MPSRAAAKSAVLGLAVGFGIVASTDAVKHTIVDRAFVEDAFGRGRWALAAGAALGAAAGVAAFVRIGRGLVRGVPVPAGAGTLRLLVYALAAGAAFHFAVIQRARLYHTSAGLAFGLFALALLARGLAARLPRRPVLAADVLLMNACVLALGGEIGLRVLARWRPSPILASADSPLAIVESHRPRPGSMKLGFPHNSRGYYDVEFAPKTPGKPLVVSIGDSFAEGVVPHDYHFTKVCERALPGAAVYNMGVASSGPREYLYLLEHEALGLRPDAVVVNLFLGNDIADSRDRGPAYRFLDLENLLLYQVPARLAKIAREREERRREGLGAAAPQIEPADERRALSPAEVLERWPWVARPLAEPPAFSKESFLATECFRARDICALTAPHHFGDFFACLAEIKAAAGATPVVFVLIPDEFQVEEALWHEVAAAAGAPLDRDLPQRVIGAWLAARGLACLDLLPVLRAVPPLADGRSHTYHAQDTHWNARGNEAAGMAMAEVLRPMLR